MIWSYHYIGMRLSMRHLGAYIEDQRGRYGLSVAQLADAVGVSPSRIALIESDHANALSNFLLGEIAEALDAPLQALLIAAGRLPPDSDLETTPTCAVYTQDELFNFAARNQGFTDIDALVRRP